jgi:hypothetical protein
MVGTFSIHFSFLPLEANDAIPNSALINDLSMTGDGRGPATSCLERSGAARVRAVGSICEQVACASRDGA